VEAVAKTRVPVELVGMAQPTAAAAVVVAAVRLPVVPAVRVELD